MSDELENVQQLVEQQTAPIEQQEIDKREEYKKADEASKQESIRILRETAEKERRLREELERKLEAINSAYNKMQSGNNVQEDISQKIYSMNDDDYVESKHVKRIAKELDDLKKAQNADIAEIKVRYKYPDIDNVVTKENIGKLDPSFFRIINSNDNIEDKFIALYHACKSFSTQKNYEEQDNRIENNRLKPRSVASASAQSSSSPLSHLSEFGSGRVVLTPEEKIRIMEECNSYIKNGTRE